MACRKESLNGSKRAEWSALSGLLWWQRLVLVLSLLCQPTVDSYDRNLMSNCQDQIVQKPAGFGLLKNVLADAASAKQAAKNESGFACVFVFGQWEWWLHRRCFQDPE